MWLILVITDGSSFYFVVSLIFCREKIIFFYHLNARNIQHNANLQNEFEDEIIIIWSRNEIDHKNNYWTVNDDVVVYASLTEKSPKADNRSIKSLGICNLYDYILFCAIPHFHLYKQSCTSVFGCCFRSNRTTKKTASIYTLSIWYCN